MSDELLAFVLARLREQRARTGDVGDGSIVDVLSSPGHDRECARAMLSQSRRGPFGPPTQLSDIQVQHLLQIGHTRGETTSDSAFVEFAIVQRLQMLHAVAARGRWRLSRTERRVLAEMPGLEVAVRFIAARFSHHNSYREEWRT